MFVWWCLCVSLCQVSSVQFPRLKEVDDVLGGQAAWENVDTTEGIEVSPAVRERVREGGREGRSVWEVGWERGSVRWREGRREVGQETISGAAAEGGRGGNPPNKIGAMTTKCVAAAACTRCV